MNIDSAKLKDYIDKFWHRPNHDNIVWLKNEGLRVSSFVQNRKKEIAAANLDPTKDAVVFLLRIGGDDLCMIDAAFQDKVFTQQECIDQKINFCVLWEAMGTGNEDGLNDCTVFVTHALSAAGLTYLGAKETSGAWAIRGPDVLLNVLTQRPPSEVKILALKASEDQLEKIFEVGQTNGILGPGDLLLLKAFGARIYHHTLLLTPSSTTMPFVDVCCHTVMNHASFGSWQGRSWNLYFSKGNPSDPQPTTNRPGHWSTSHTRTLTPSPSRPKQLSISYGSGNLAKARSR